MKHTALAAFLAAIIFSSCNQKMDSSKHQEMVAARMDSAQKELLQTDIDFSKMSQDKGRAAAFIAYADSNVTILRPNSMPVTGLDNLTGYINSHSDSEHVLTWIPLRAEVSRSADFGFTYGTYSEDLNGKGKSEGTYCTVWKKGKDNKWKYVLDTGNPGLASADKEDGSKHHKAAEKTDAPKVHKKHKKH
jgi:hypothetical protein